MTHTQTTCLNRIARVKKGARSAEDGALASVIEKSATEFKLKQNLLKCKRTIQITTFNDRTLNRIEQQSELIASAIDAYENTGTLIARISNTTILAMNGR